MTDKLKRPPTSGTRKGNGSGWGGPARGAEPRAETIQTRAPFDGTTGHEYGEGHLGARKAARQAKAMDILDRAMDEGDTWQVRIMAADKMLDRIEGKPVQKVVTPDSAPSWFIQGEPEAESVEAWTDMASLATAKPVGSAD